jgi:hypothetical protein
MVILSSSSAAKTERVDTGRDDAKRADRRSPSTPDTGWGGIDRLAQALFFFVFSALQTRTRCGIVDGGLEEEISGRVFRPRKSSMVTGEET